MTNTPRGPNWVLTLFPTEEELSIDESSLLTKWTSSGKIEGLCGQAEICPESGKLHYQIYVKFNNSIRLAQVKTIFGSKVHAELRKGTEMEAIAYCTKELTRKPEHSPFFFGNFGKQGERSDLEGLKEQLLSGETTVEKIVIASPMKYHQYGRTLHKIEDLAMRMKYRTSMTTCDWIYGPTGVGKSHEAFKDYNPATHYIYKLNDGNGWQDGYTGQEIVIINDFRGEIKFGELLTLIDKWPHTLPRRGREPVPFLAKHIIITASRRPEEIYHNLALNDNLEQLLRRINVIYKPTI